MTDSGRRIRLVHVGDMPTPSDIAVIAGVLDDPDAALLPVADPRSVAAVPVEESLAAYDEPTVLAVATTGSTGAPKVVLHGASSLRASIDATAGRMGGHGQWLLAMPMLHIAGIQVVLRSVVAGQDVVLPQDVSTAEPGHFEDRFASGVRRMTGSRRYTSLVPTQLHRLVHSAQGREALGGVDAVLLGGAAADPELVDEARSLGVAVLTTYGMSETAGGCVYDGVPLDGVDVSIDDGIVVLRGPVVAQGYLQTPEPNPFRDGGFVTSDLGTLVDGRLRILGRADDVINTGGKKVAPVRVEEALRSLPGIVDALVVGVPDAEWGERVGALLVGPDGRDSAAGGTSAAALEAIRAQLRGVLDAHELPTAAAYVDALPLKGIGKPDRTAARTHLLRWVRGGSGRDSHP